MALASPEDIETALETSVNGIAAVFAVPLRTATEFQGVIYLGYRQPHYFDSTERNLLRTLAGQATVLVHNAHLFTAAESGRQRLAAILASTTNAVIVTDQTDRVLLTNPAMERAFHFRVQEVAGRPVLDVIKPKALAQRLSIRGDNGKPVSLPGGVGKVELEANGRTFVANIATVHSSAGQALGRVAVLHDVTDFKDLDRMKSDFLAGVSHDLLSPLTYMSNYASLLPMTDDPALRQEYADKILGGIDRMTHMINDLLDLARIGAGMNLQVAPINLNQLLMDIAQEHWSHANMVGVTIKSHVTGMPVVQGDPVLIRRAVTNLVTNAIKYAPHSGDLLLHATAAGREFIITVHDNGPGIPPEELPQLFESFYRGPQHIHSGTRGSGLGLAIVKSIVELHGGRVWCESEGGDGAIFVIALPAKPRFGNPNTASQT
ncbi:MAG: ATP-binding protein [Chloroflexota bacterium]